MIIDDDQHIKETIFDNAPLSDKILEQDGWNCDQVTYDAERSMSGCVQLRLFTKKIDRKLFVVIKETVIRPKIQNIYHKLEWEAISEKYKLSETNKDVQTLKEIYTMIYKVMAKNWRSYFDYDYGY